MLQLATNIQEHHPILHRYIAVSKFTQRSLATDYKTSTCELGHFGNNEDIIGEDAMKLAVHGLD